LVIGLAKIANIPPDVVKICKILRADGHQGYVVGGATRDLFLRKSPKDWDIATDALPDTVTGIFKGYRVIPTGIDHGTVTVMINNEGYEVTTFRVDGDYSDGRRPDNVDYTTNLQHDLERRDFTVNAMAYDPVDDVLITVGDSMNHLRGKLIKCVGDPNERFKEDALRMLRACRFAATLGFDLDESVIDAITNNAKKIKNVSMERIRDEMMGMMKADKPSIGLEYMRITGLIYHVMPELAEGIGIDQPKNYHIHTVWYHNLYVCDNIPKSKPVLRWIGLNHDVGKPGCRIWSVKQQRHKYIDHEKVGSELVEKIMTRMKFAKDDIAKAIPLVRWHMAPLHFQKGRMTNKGLRRMMVRVGEHNLEDLVDICRADVISSGVLVDESNAHIDFMLDRISKLSVETNGKAGITLSDLTVDGNDVMNILGVEPCKRVGDALEYLLDEVLEDPRVNTKDKLTEMLIAKYVTTSNP